MKFGASEAQKLIWALTYEIKPTSDGIVVVLITPVGQLN